MRLQPARSAQTLDLMSATPRIAVLVAAVGSAIIVAIAMVHYALAARASAPGDYRTWMLGSVGIGILCGTASLCAQPKADRTWWSGLAAGAVGAVLGAIVLLVAIVSAFGS